MYYNLSYENLVDTMLLQIHLCNYDSSDNQDIMIDSVRASGNAEVHVKMAPTRRGD